MLDKEQAQAGMGPDGDEDEEAAIQSRLEDHETQLAEDKALAEAENDDPEALLAAGTKALDTTTAALRNLAITKSDVASPPRHTVCTPKSYRALFLSLT